MKVVVFGGAGDMGRQAVEILAADERITQLVIADYRADQALMLAVRFPGKAIARFVDASQEFGIAQILEGADVAVNCIGPFYRFAFPVTEAAIAARVSLVDICDDHDALRKLLKLDEQARSAGITVLTGIGWTPGISNLLALEAACGLETPVDVRISWVGTAADYRGVAVIKHLLHAMHGKVPMVENGQPVEVEAGTGAEQVEFPPPIGSATVSYCGHPEPLTLPRAVPQARTVTIKGGLKPDWVSSVGAFLAKAGFCSTDRRQDMTACLLHRFDFLFRGNAAECSGVRVDVTGMCDGRSVTRTRAVVDRVARLTGIPAALAALLILERKIDRQGVCAPEQAIQPAAFFRRLRAYGIQIYEWEE